jgi:ATP-dependent Clp protease ATP-binding subunit ClpA
MSWSCESIAPEAAKVLERAAPEALSLGLDYVGTEAVLLAMIRVGAPELSDTLRRVGSSFTQLEAAIRQSTVGSRFPPPVEPLAFASRAIRAIEYAGQCARTRQHSQVSNRDLLVGLLSERDGLAHSILADIGVDIPTVLAGQTAGVDMRGQSASGRLV